MRTFLFVLFVLAFQQAIYAQKPASISITTDRMIENKVTIWTSDYVPQLEMRKPIYYVLDNGFLQKKFVLEEPVQINIYGKYKSKDWSKEIYLSPGDSIYVNIDSTGVKITGHGASKNQDGRPSYYVNTEGFEKDTLPDNYLKTAETTLARYNTDISNYIAKHNPTSEFVNMYTYNKKYALVSGFISFYGNQKFQLRRLANFEELQSIWDHKRDSLLSLVDLNDEKALISPYFKNLVENYTLRKKEELWSLEDKRALFAKFYADIPEQDRNQAFASDPENLFVEKLINSEFDGAVQEYMYNHLFSAMKEEKKTNAIQIFDRFVQKYPNSKYIPRYAKMITEARVNDSRQLTEKMILVEDLSAYNTMNQIVDLFKGKTVLVDMWGTWCGPCHKEIEKHAHALKEHFQNENVAFLYVSNYDQNNIEGWKKLISYYNLEGTHILANENLTKDILAKTGAQGFPSYIIIKPDGTYELSTAGYPMNREKLIQQIEKTF